MKEDIFDHLTRDRTCLDLLVPAACKPAKCMPRIESEVAPALSLSPLQGLAVIVTHDMQSCPYCLTPTCDSAACCKLRLQRELSHAPHAHPRLHAPANTNFCVCVCMQRMSQDGRNETTCWACGPEPVRGSDGMQFGPGVTRQGAPG